MKNKYIFGVLAAAAMAMTGCNDFLNDNRYPLSSQVVNPEFWSNSVNVQNQINYFYEDYSGYGNGAGFGTFYFSWLSDDQCGRTAFVNWKYTAVPGSDGSYTAPYTEIRRANLVIAGVESSSLTANEKANYTALARLHRGRSYYDLVRRYGDVVLAKTTVDVTDTDVLYGTRTNRNEVMDFVLEDLNYAVENIAAENGKTTFSKDMAQAFKLEVCLYEGAYARYHQKDEARATKFFGEAEKAGLAVADKYPVGTAADSYASLYNRINYADLGKNPEIIMYKGYAKDVFMNSITDYSNATDGVAGITRDAFQAFLFKDGLPASKTTYNTTEEGVAEGNAAMSIQNLLDVRDARLSAITYPYAAYETMPYTASNTGGFKSSTGYGVQKFNNPAMPFADVNNINKNYCSAPLFWGARVCVGLLEAKAELGGSHLTDADLAKYMKPLWDRAGITPAGGLTVAFLEGIQDPANNMNVSSLIWEMRRLRRCELMLDDDVRYWDLIRWHQLDKLDTTKYPNIVLGANVKNAPIAPNAVKGDYVDGSFGRERVFEEKYYLYPIPAQQIQLNPNLTQNPGW